MLAQTERLREENSKLRLREMRFTRNPLLRRRICDPKNAAASTPILLMALQNEVSASFDLVPYVPTCTIRNQDTSASPSKTRKAIRGAFFVR